MLHSVISGFRLLAASAVLLLLGACYTVDEGPGEELDATAGSFVWHDLITHDLDAASSFYGVLLGWEFEQAVPREGYPYLLAKKDGRYAGGIIEIPRPADGNDYARWLGYMLVEDINASIARTPSSGGQVIEAVRDRGEVGKIAAISDSQRAVLGLIESQFDTGDQVLRDARGAVVWNELLAADIEAAAEFYTALAGVEANTIERRGGRYTLLESGGVQHAGILKLPLDDTDPLWLSYFAVGDPASAAAEAEALGGKVILAPSAELREGSMALIQDPQGVVLALQKWPL